MGVYGKTGIVTEGAEVEDMQTLVESFIFDELAQLPDAVKKEFLVSEECKAMEEAGTIGRRTIVRLNKTDDLSRRIKIAAFQMAKEKDDPVWQALVKNRIRERQLIGKLVQRYGNQATRTAKIGQREFLKVMPQAYTRPISAGGASMKGIGK
jgi:hypothetical protein